MDDRPDRVPEDGAIDGYRPSYIDVDGTRTRYYDVGEGEPLVLVHGGAWEGFASANTWSRTFEHLRDRFRVLALDRIGCGLTDNPDRPEAYVYDTDLAHAIGFLDAMDLDTCHLAGFSRGGGLATRVAVEIPDRVSTLTINNSATLGPPVTDNAYRRSRLFRMEPMGLSPTDPDYLRHYYEQYCYQTDFITEERCRIGARMHRHPKFEEAATVLDAQDPEEGWLATLEDHMRTTHRRITEGVLDMPVLYLYGLNDLTVPLEMSAAAFQLIAKPNERARMEVLNKCGHMSFLEKPEEFAHRVSGFIDWFGSGER